MTNFMPNFSQADYDIMIRELSIRRGVYMVGDAFYNELDEIIKELERRKESAVPRLSLIHISEPTRPY